MICKGVADAVSFPDWDGFITIRSTSVKQYVRQIDIGVLLDIYSNQDLNNLNVNHFVDDLQSLHRGGGAMYPLADDKPSITMEKRIWSLAITVQELNKEAYSICFGRDCRFNYYLSSIIKCILHIV